ncbi:MAG: ABC transporter ATP-binding protein [Bacilli bacterium]|nr:ABC transporter ATP-binding protein [Acholeplasmataceae bacterium]MDY2902272.1 ABC transporter ATP-binding protein [Bacilli bacterium]
MVFLELNNISKFYVDKDNVYVGVKDINLTFEIGEFVAITGKSGSGKTTLLNIIGGIDTYEKGKLLINGEQTSHFTQSDWEEYRQRYISFIFQDYNIIDSFTVLENVELALMHIKDCKERKAKAKDLIKKVGMTPFINNKGSKLSGGQKQRTVIARALAKESPIILADEPTGNLDSKTAKEIIELLKEVSKNKLVIMVTHSFSMLQGVASREIRIFDGKVEFDNVLNKKLNIDRNLNNDKTFLKNDSLYNGFTLGKKLLFSKPKLAIYLCSLMILGMILMFSITVFCNNQFDSTENVDMFDYVDGRVLLMKKDESPITSSELNELEKKYSAKSSLRYDYLMDQFSLMYYSNYGSKKTLSTRINYDINFGNCDYGTYPQQTNEVMLYLPICFKRIETYLHRISLYNIFFDVSGIKYFYDNNKTPYCILNEEGYKIVSSVCFLRTHNIACYFETSSADILYINNFYTSFTLDSNKYMIVDDNFNINNIKNINFTLKISYQINEEKNNTIKLKKDLYYFNNYDKTDFCDFEQSTHKSVILGTQLIQNIADEIIEYQYKQSSLFFKNDREAKKAIKDLKNNGYIATLSNVTYYKPSENVAMGYILNMLLILLWIITVLIVSLFLYLCLSKSLNAFNGDLAIFRSMGIKTTEIKIAICTRIFLTLVPAILVLIIMAIIIYTSPILNPLFPFLYLHNYLLIILGLISICCLITFNHLNKMFNKSVKKALRGDYND